MNEKVIYSKGKSIALTTLCVILTVLVCVLLLGCFAAHRVIYDEPVGEAFSEVQTEQIRLRDGTLLVTKLSQDYIGEGIVSEEKLTRILHDGYVDTWIGEKAEAYARFISEHEQYFPMILTPELEEVVAQNEGTIRLHTGLHDFGENNPQMFINMKPDLENWNREMRSVFAEGISSKLISAATSTWILYVLGVLLLALLIWMTSIGIRSQERVGTVFKRYAVTCFVPGVIMLLWGLIGDLILKLAGCGYIQPVVKALHGAPILSGGLVCLACVALFILGILWNTIAGVLENRPRRVRQTAPARQPVLAAAAPVQPAVSLTKEPEPVQEPVNRKYCRFCGGELVNTDAKFCYKCGKAQE